MKLLVTGREGQLARSLAERAAAHENVTVATIARPELDLARPEAAGEALARAIEREEPDTVVSAAAYTAVDRAEEEPELARLVNAEAPGRLAAACARAGVPIVHISTDYVFDGTLDRPYREDDPVAPLGVYGRTKEEGERRVREANPDHVVLRTAWVTSPFGTNFVRTMLRLAQTRDRLSVVADQHGCPTSALDIADAIVAIVRRRLSEGEREGDTVHVANRGETTWAGLARHVFDRSRTLGGPFAAVDSISTSQYPTPARRPPNSRLDCSRLEEAYGVLMPSWGEAQTEIVQRLLAGDRKRVGQ